MTEVMLCPECGSGLPAGAPPGPCPRCLLKTRPSHSLETPMRSGAVPTSLHQGPLPALPPSALAPHFPHLEVLELVGQGGMGAVYKARQLKLDRIVALKVLSAEASRDGAFAERFMREARAMARLNHPHIVTIHDFGESDGLFYFIMEFVDGQSLRQALQARPIDLPQALHLIPQICDALQYAHDEDIVHRDIKPENILLDKRGRVKIADFGLAKLVGLTPAYLTLTGSHQVMGTLYYMAPEQMQKSHTVDQRADIYSLGVVCYEMLTGELPLGRFAPPSRKAPVPKELDAIVLRALAKEPEDRFQHVGELRAAVVELSADAPKALPVGEPSKSDAPSQVLSVPISMEVFEDGDYVSANGLARMEDDCLVLEYMSEYALEKNPKAPIQEKRIALTDIMSLDVEQGWRPKLKVRAGRLSILAGIGGGDRGEAKLSVAQHDCRAAEQMAAWFAHKRFGRSVAPVSDDGLRNNSGPVNYLEMVRLDVKAPAAGLMVTAITAALSWALMLALIPVERYTRFGFQSRALGDEFPVLVPVVFVPIVFMLIGVWRMRTLKGYEFALIASILAMIPWSPAFPVGLGMGIWALVVLRRPEVRAAFAHEANPSNLSFTPPPSLTAAHAVPPRRGPLGRMFSLFHSVGGYCFDTRGKAGPSVAEHDSSAERKTV